LTVYFEKRHRFCRSAEARRKSVGFALVLAAACLGGIRDAAAQDLAAVESARRGAIIAALPEDAAKRVFGLIATPSAGPAQSIGGYGKGCIAGAVPLPPDGPNWQVMRPARNRAWGHPILVATIERLAAALPQASGWSGWLVGDLGQPRGGPMVTGHASHQIGLDADIWFTPMPELRLSAAERDNMAAGSIVAADGNDVDRTFWGPQYRRVIEAVARAPELARMFVNPAIKQALCREVANSPGTDRDWLRKVRPWWGHDDHFHIRLTCPAEDRLCQNQPPLPPGDGCGELAWWFTAAGRHPKPGPPERPLKVSELPPACAGVAAAK
jgi:penicillin-insensitive murein endopeptidase